MTLHDMTPSDSDWLAWCHQHKCCHSSLNHWLLESFSGPVKLNDDEGFPCTLFPKRKATLISRFFMVTLEQGQWRWVMCTRGNALGSNKQKTLLKNIKRFCQYIQCPLTLWKRWGILELGFWQIVTRSNVQMKFGPKFTDLHFSPQKRQLQKSCVSFGEECSNMIAQFCSDYHGHIM